MNREILFRGKRVDNGEWVEGYFVKYQPCASKDEWIVGIVPDYASSLYLIEVALETVSRFTSLTDKNGKKIFEGDIIECDSERFIIVWDADFAGFYLDDIDPDYEGCVCIDDASKDGYIIGNIHDGGIEI